jgi:hypothetical protein
MSNDSDRIAIRECATELTPLQIEMVSGGINSKEYQCDAPTDCWVDGGRYVSNDD